MNAPKATAVLELAAGQKNKKGVVMKTNRLKVSGDISGTIYLPNIDSEKYEVILKPLK